MSIKRAVASLETLRPLSSILFSLNLSMRAFPTVVLPHRDPPPETDWMSRLPLISISEKASISGADDFKVANPSLIPFGITHVQMVRSCMAYKFPAARRPCDQVDRGVVDATTSKGHPGH
ncbi:hypothetical protein BASA84_001531 [Batrachochytrium salamandrivorans]|nr:hypothetical protein BASA84_001531 [Batrachochytrium salamandrivorans]